MLATGLYDDLAQCMCPIVLVQLISTASYGISHSARTLLVGESLTISPTSGALRAVLKSLREAEEITEICN